ATHARAVALAAVAVAIALPALRWAPAGWAEKAARAHAATVRERDRSEDLRSRAKVLHAGVGPAGATALRQLGADVLAELDGAPADPASRAGEAERFAGTLAACATAGRAHARIGGDDLGLALAALRAQGFALVDTAVPDAGLVRAQAAARPALERLWLHPAVRLVARPSPVVVRLGEDADVVVEIARAPWTDGRVRFPDARGFRATRATLAPGGVHVLALGGTALSAEVFEGVLRAFADTYATASLWLPPSGADTAVLLGAAASDARIAWATLERCVAADREALAGMALRSAADVAGLALADGAALRALPEATPPPGIPATVREPPALHLTRFAEAAFDPASVFASDAPLAELKARGEARAGFLRLLAASTSGDTRATIERAREIASTPGGARALEPLVRPHLAHAREAMAEGRREGPASKAWDAAEAALSTARLVHPGLAETRCLEGELAVARGQLLRAEEAFAACAELDPSSADAWQGLAFVRIERRNVVGAEEALRAGVAAAAPDDWMPVQRLGVFLMKLGRHAEAEPLLRQAAAGSAKGGAAVAAPHLALASLYLATDRPDAALLEAKTAMAAERSADALALHGNARAMMRQHDAAERDLRAALELDPRHPGARLGLGGVQAARGEYEHAAASFRAVLEADPGNAIAKSGLERLAPLLREREE
ncbi:MAG: tetratricopeptide repeat protein, partial [Myxococcota bacterium]